MLLQYIKLYYIFVVQASEAMVDELKEQVLQYCSCNDTSFVACIVDLLYFQ